MQGFTNISTRAKLAVEAGAEEATLAVNIILKDYRCAIEGGHITLRAVRLWQILHVDVACAYTCQEIGRDSSDIWAA